MRGTLQLRRVGCYFPFLLVSGIGADGAARPSFRTATLNAPLLRFPRAELSLLQSVYSQLDEPDGLSGILALRVIAINHGAAGGKASGDAIDANVSLSEQIIDCEHDGRWSEALVCFEQAIQRLQVWAG